MIQNYFWTKFSNSVHSIAFFALQRGCVLFSGRSFFLQLVSEIVAKTMNWWKKIKLRKRSHKLISKSLADYLLSCIKEITIGGSRVSFLNNNSILLPSRLDQGPLITDGRNSNKMFILPTGLLQDTLGISKVIKVSLSNLNDKDFRS